MRLMIQAYGCDRPAAPLAVGETAAASQWRRQQREKQTVDRGCVLLWDSELVLNGRAELHGRVRLAWQRDRTAQPPPLGNGNRFAQRWRVRRKSGDRRSRGQGSPGKAVAAERQLLAATAISTLASASWAARAEVPPLPWIRFRWIQFLWIRCVSTRDHDSDWLSNRNRRGGLCSGGVRPPGLVQRGSPAGLSMISDESGNAMHNGSHPRLLISAAGLLPPPAVAAGRKGESRPSTWLAKPNRCCHLGGRSESASKVAQVPCWTCMRPMASLI